MDLNADNKIVVLGETNFRGQRWRFGIKHDDRRRHMYVVGSTGMGKSEFLKNMAIQDIEAGRGVAFIDPHGDAVDDILDHIPEDRIKDVVYFDPGDLSYPVAFNVMEGVDFDHRHLVASGLVGVFKKIWGVEAWSGRMEYILNNTILALLEYPGSTLLGINRMMSNKEYRKKVVANLKDPIVKSFWVEEFAKYADRFATEATAAIQNKVGQFSSNNLIRNIIGQSRSKIDIRKAMDKGKILLANVSRGKIGEDASRLLGAFLVTKIQLAAMSRVDIPERERKDFYLYVDEFQHFATESFANILSEARKYHLSLIMTHQYIKQMEDEVRDAVFGNVGTIVSFRVGAEDAEFLEKWFAPDFQMSDIVNLGKYNIYLKLMIDGVSSKGFSAATIPPFPKLEHSNREEIIDHSRQLYATPRDEVEGEIGEWAGAMEEESREAQRAVSSQPPKRYPMQQRQNNYSSGPPRRPSYNDRPVHSEQSRTVQRSYDQTVDYGEPLRQAPSPAEATAGRQDRPSRTTEERRSAPKREPVQQVPSSAKAPEDRQDKPSRTTEERRPTSQEPSLRPVQYRTTDEETVQPRQKPRTLGWDQKEDKKPIHVKPKFEESQRKPLKMTPRHESQAPKPKQESTNSLDQLLKREPVNFKGKKIRHKEERKEKPKAEVNTDDLRKALMDAMADK